MKIYNYHYETKEFMSETVAKENPLEKGNYLIPAGATTQKPLEPKDGFNVVYNNGWEYQAIIEDNSEIENQEPEQREPYVEQRIYAYPSIEEQLDMQYWDKVNGTTTWEDAIAKVKLDNPKE